VAGSSRYTAVLDACVLHPAPVRDLLLSLAAAGLYHARWTDQIQAEWIDSLLARRPDLDRQKLQRTADLMAQAVPDCLVKGYGGMIDALPARPRRSACAGRSGRGSCGRDRDLQSE